MTDKTGSPPCGIYIQIKADALEEGTLLKLRQMAMGINQGSGYEKNFTLVEFVLNDDPTATEKIAALVQVAQADGLVAIIRNDYKAAHEMNADGVVLDTLSDAKAARDLMGRDKIFGLSCGTDKDMAEQAIKNELDYVEFGSEAKAPPSDLLLWWSTKSTNPCIARGPLTNDNAGSFAKAGAGLVDATNYIFTHEKGVTQGTVNILYALEIAVGGGIVAN